MKILCTGMMVCDTLLSPVPSNVLELDSVRINKPSVCCGGDALNVAMGLARLRNEKNSGVSIIGRIADDANGRFILKECGKNGVDVSGVIFDKECATAASYALIDQEGERHFLTDKAIFERLKGSDVPDEAIREADVVYFGSAMAMKEMDADGIRDIFKRAHSFGKLTAMDAAVNREDGDRDWLACLAPALRETDIFFPSMNEVSKLTGETDPEKAAEYFKPFSMKLFGVKLGGEGCFATDFKENRRIPCPKGMPVVDTTGAGDSFMAGLLCGLAQGFDFFTSAEFAVCVATKNVGAMGGTAGIPDYSEALRFYRSFKENEERP